MEIRPEEFLDFDRWIGGAMFFLIRAVPILIAVFLFVWYLIASVRHGPVEGFWRMAKTIAVAFSRDLPDTSFRRIWAISRLAMQEALRRRVLVAFAVFALVLLFAGWILDNESTDPAHLYLSFVLTTTNYLALMLGLFLSTFSIPADIKTRTIYTVLTKPVRAGELVFGRILGFTLVGTAMLGAMAVMSYFFVTRGLDHDHGVIANRLEPIPAEELGLPEGGAGLAYRGLTTQNSYHRHTFETGPDGRGRTDRTMGHWHSVTIEEGGETPRITLGPPRGALEARVPIYGALRFKDREGNDVSRGISVGKEWSYRSYIEGRTFAAGIWTFDDVTRERFPDGLPLELTLSVFRTHKGDMTRGIRGVILVTNPRTGLQSEPIPFESMEFTIQRERVPVSMKPMGRAGAAGRDIDLFDDLVHDGQVEIWIMCDEAGQYFGMAQADLYIRGADQPFAMNFVKGYIGIWLQMIMVTAFGVMFSTFLSSPVALLATLSTILLGYFSWFIEDVWSGEAVGGGPVEATIRLLLQKNLVTDLDLGMVANQIMRWTDFFLLSTLRVVTAVLPDFNALGRPATYVAYNFNVMGELLMRHTLTTALYVIGITAVGYFCLRTREIAA